jgi:prepilin peptidase CpaA
MGASLPAPMLPMLLLMLLLAAVLDQRTGHIPNWLTLGLLVVGVSGSVVPAFAAAGLLAAAKVLLLALAGGLLCAVVPFVLYRFRALGAGDVKLFMALGAAFHAKLGLEAELAAFVIAAMLAPAKLAWEGKLLRNLFEGSRLMFAAVLRTNGLRPATQDLAWFRLGPSIFLGVLYVALARFGGT